MKTLMMSECAKNVAESMKLFALYAKRNNKLNVFSI